MIFNRRKLGDFIDTISDTTKIEKEKVILINTSDVLEGKVLNHDYVDNLNLKGQFKKRFKKYDILYSEIRPANKRFAYVDFDSEDYIASTKLMVLRNKGNIDNRYLYNLLSSNSIINELHRIAVLRSGTFPQITFTELSNVEVNIPDIEDQKKISYILDLISNKIENNNRINDNLELELKLLFNKTMSSCDNFDEYILYDEFEVIDNRGKTPPNVDYSDYPIIDVKVLSGENRVIDYSYSTKYVSKDTYNSFFRNGHPKINDTLISTVGSLAEMKLYLENIGTIAQNVVALRPKNNYPLFMYQYLLDIRKKLTSYDIGSVQPSIKVTQFMKEKINIPRDKSIIEKYESIARVYTDKMKNIYQENRTLLELKNTIIPKLMNGEIDITNINIS